MGETLKDYIRDHYVGKYDVYGAFIERCLSFSSEDGHVSMVTPENFMFLYYFRGLRKELLNESYFIEAAHLSRYGFEQQKDAYTIPFVLRGSNPSEGELSRFYRMTHEQEHYKNYERKITGLREIADTLRSGEKHEDVYVFSQSRIDDIGRRPFLYWFGEETLSLFTKYESLKNVADLNQGLSTSNDEGLVKKWWELPDKLREEEYVRFQKSGTDAEYYDYPQDYVPWTGRRSELEESGANFRNEEHYFDEGVTFRRFGSYFVGRKQYDDGIFSDKAIFTTSEELSDELLISHFNATLFRYLANGLNPGINFEIGDAERFPVKTEFERQEKLESLASMAVENRENISSIKEISADYNGETVVDCIEEGPADLLAAEEAMQARVISAHGASDNILFQEYGISKETREQMYTSLPKNTVEFPVAKGCHVELSDTLVEHVTLKSISDDRLIKAANTLSSIDEPTLREGAVKTGLSPLTIAQLRFEHELYSDDEITEAAGRIVSLIIGSLFGRWNTGGNAPTVDDELLAFEVRDESLETLIRNSIEKIFDDGSAVEEALETALGSRIDEWVRERFFRHHHVDEYKPRGERSPIYWQLESPNGGFSCFIYYHDIDANTLPKLRGQYLDPRIDELENELETLNAQTSGNNPEKELLSRKEEVQNHLNDIKDFRDTIDEMIDDGVTVGVEEGIWENIKEWDQYEVLETGLPKLKSSYTR
jgi:hypothetical protein